MRLYCGFAEISASEVGRALVSAPSMRSVAGREKRMVVVVVEGVVVVRSVNKITSGF